MCTCACRCIAARKPTEWHTAFTAKTSVADSGVCYECVRFPLTTVYVCMSRACSSACTRACVYMYRACSCGEIPTHHVNRLNHGPKRKAVMHHSPAWAKRSPVQQVCRVIITEMFSVGIIFNTSTTVCGACEGDATDCGLEQQAALQGISRVKMPVFSIFGQPPVDGDVIEGAADGAAPAPASEKAGECGADATTLRFPPSSPLVAGRISVTDREGVELLATLATHMSPAIIPRLRKES